MAPEEYPEVLKDTGQVLQWFGQLSQTRSYNDNMPLPITYQEIHAWMQLFKHDLPASCIELIKTADSAFLNAMSLEIKDDRERNG